MPALAGEHCTNVRWTYVLPRQDTPGFLDCLQFGSAHSGGFNVVFCDGSTRSISYTIDADVHRSLGNRKDGEPIDGSQF